MVTDGVFGDRDVLHTTGSTTRFSKIDRFSIPKHAFLPRLYLLDVGLECLVIAYGNRLCIAFMIAYFLQLVVLTKQCARTCLKQCLKDGLLIRNCAGSGFPNAATDNRCVGPCQKRLNLHGEVRRTAKSNPQAWITILCILMAIARLL